VVAGERRGCSAESLTFNRATSWQQWYRGRDAIARFLTWTTRPGGRGPFRLMPTAGNGQPAFAFYSGPAQMAAPTR
jgi:hypothetical protein